MGLARFLVITLAFVLAIGGILYFCQGQVLPGVVLLVVAGILGVSHAP